MRTMSKSPDIPIAIFILGTEEIWHIQSKNVMKATVRKTVTALIRNCLYFFLRSLMQYSKEVAMRALLDSPVMFSALVLRWGLSGDCTDVVLSMLRVELSLRRFCTSMYLGSLLSVLVVGEVVSLSDTT